MKKISIWIGLFLTIGLLGGCGNKTSDSMKNDGKTTSGAVKAEEGSGREPAAQTETVSDTVMQYQRIDTNITELENGFSVVKFEGDYGFDDFLSQGGAQSDADVLHFLTGRLLGSAQDLTFQTEGFGCSTLSVENAEGGYYFGRNFDWNRCNALVVAAYPENGFASVSTVNMDFIRQGAGFATAFMSGEILTFAALYAPLDGMNEKGLCVSVNMIQDSDTISQNTEKGDITTTTAIRLLLDRAATVDEALELLSEYDFHASMNYMVHLAIADSTGKSVAVEYIDDEMVVIETPVLTNFYLAKGKKQGIGTKQSHTRFEILNHLLDETPQMDDLQVRDALSAVSKGNFGEFESTEWSVVFDQTALTAVYYHRENYSKSYVFSLYEK